MDSIITIITAAFAIAVVWAVFFYVTGIRRDRKIMDEYIAKKHGSKVRFKKPASSRQAPVRFE